MRFNVQGSGIVVMVLVFGFRVRTCVCVCVCVLGTDFPGLGVPDSVLAFGLYVCVHGSHLDTGFGGQRSRCSGLGIWVLGYGLSFWLSGCFGFEAHRKFRLRVLGSGSEIFVRVRGFGLEG